MNTENRKWEATFLKKETQAAHLRKWKQNNVPEIELEKLIRSAHNLSLDFALYPGHLNTSGS